MTTTNILDALVDLIAERVAAKLKAADEPRLLDVKSGAKYIGRSPTSLRNLIAIRAIPSVRQDKRVFLDRQDLDRWIDLNKAA